MITLKAGKLAILKETIESFIKYTETNPIDFILANKLSKIIDKLEYALFEYSKTKDQLIKKYGRLLPEELKTEEQKDREVYFLDPKDKNYNEFKEIEKKLDEQTFELTNVFFLKEEDFIDVKIPLTLMAGLHLLIEPAKEVEKEKKIEFII